MHVENMWPSVNRSVPTRDIDLTCPYFDCHDIHWSHKFDFSIVWKNLIDDHWLYERISEDQAVFPFYAEACPSISCAKNIRESWQ